jgi:glycosyltransferase involved in cell wall biosynthesis
MKLSVVLPVFNEESILEEACCEFSIYFNKTIGEDEWQFVFSENGSNDNSSIIIDELIKKYNKSIHLSIDKPDYGNALKQGIATSEGDYIMIMNVDHLWDSNYFDWAWGNRNNYDLILGSKRADPTLNQQDNYRKILSAVLNALLQYFFDSVVSDTHGMKLLKATTLKPVAEQCVMKRGQFDTELTLRALRNQCWVAEIPIPYLEKRKARNFMFKKIIQNFIDIITLISVMKKVKYMGSLKYRRFCREDLMDNEV